MKLLLSVFLIALALVFGGTLSGPLVERWNDANAYQRQLDALQIEHEQTALRDWQAQQQATFASRALASNGFYLLTLILGGVVVYALYDGYQQRRRPLIRPDRYGQLPVSRAALVDGEYKALVYQVAREVVRVHQLQAIHQPGQLPNNYAPHISQPARLPDVQNLHNPQLGAGEGAGVPTFGALLDLGRVGKGNPLLLGYDLAEGGELTGSWLDLYSTVVAGMSGTGKTTTQRFLACQTALHGARFAIIDPHAGAAEDSLAGTLAPLQGAFVCEPASTDKAILEVVRYVADVGRRRIEGKDSDTTPLILWADELTSLLGRSAIGDDLAELLERIAQEYRKRFVFVCGSGQIWTAARATSELRDSFASVLCHRMKRSQARLLLPTDEAEQVERLATGTAVLWRTSGETQTIAIPNTTAGDVSRVASLLATPRLPDMPDRSQFEADVKPPMKPSGSQRVAAGDWLPSAAVSAEARRAATMFMEGADPAVIVWELRGVKSSQGGKYQATLAEVLNLVREGMRGAARAT
jgi:hypothetical protein